jgi:restriction system protein
LRDPDVDFLGRFGPLVLAPAEFEQLVASMLRKQGVGLSDFKVQHLEAVQGLDGEYAIDVTARFEALGADFLVLIECKHQSRPVEREVVQILVDKVRSTGAQKGMLFATTRFQRGALEYARLHGVALVRVADGRTTYETRSAGPTTHFPPWLPRHVGWLTQLNREGNESFASLGEVELSSLEDAFAPHTA